MTFGQNDRMQLNVYNSIHYKKKIIGTSPRQNDQLDGSSGKEISTLIRLTFTVVQTLSIHIFMREFIKPGCINDKP